MLTAGAVVAPADEADDSKPADAELATIARADLRSKIPIAPIASSENVASFFFLPFFFPVPSVSASSRGDQFPRAASP